MQQVVERCPLSARSRHFRRQPFLGKLHKRPGHKAPGIDECIANELLDIRMLANSEVDDATASTKKINVVVGSISAHYDPAANCYTLEKLRRCGAKSHA